MFPLLLATVLISTPLVPPIVKDAQSLYEYERKNFTYQAEPVGEDYWKSAEEVVRDKGANCAGFAFFNEKVLTDLGYEAHVIAIYGTQEGKKIGHAICVVKMTTGKWRYYSNTAYSYFKDFESITDIINFEMPEWKMWARIERPHKFVDKHIQTN